MQFLGDSIDDLQIKIETVEKGKDVIKANALVLNLVRNFSGHNFESKPHKFFKNSNKYLARIIFSLIYIKKQGRI